MKTRVIWTKNEVFGHVPKLPLLTNEKTKDNLRNLNKFINGDIKKTPSMKLKSKGDDLVLLSQNLTLLTFILLIASVGLSALCSSQTREAQPSPRPSW